MTIKIFRTIVLSVSILIASQANAQTTEAALRDTIFKKDSLFWQAYNNCATEATKEFFTEDVEFYHDKGGITLGVADMAGSLKNNLCSNPDWRLRRQAVASTIQLFPLYKNNIIYGAIFSGDHQFHITEKGKKEYHSGNAKFTHLWLLKDDQWKMKRLLSYDHQAAAYQSNKTQVTVPATVLQQYVGTYNGTQTGLMTITKEQGWLVLQIKDKTFQIYPATETKFFSKERDLDFEFVKNAKGVVEKMQVVENGKVVEEAVRK